MMVVKKLMVLETQFDFISKRFSSGNMLQVIGSIWVFVCSHLFLASGFISRYILIRFQADDRQHHHDHQIFTDENREEAVSFNSHIIRRNDYQNRAETEDSDRNRVETEDSDQNRAETEDSDRNKAEIEDSSYVETVVSTDLYEFTSGRVIDGFMEEPKAMSFVVQELYADWGTTKIAEYQKPKDNDADEETAKDSVQIVEALENGEVRKPITDQIDLQIFSEEKDTDAEIELCEVEEDSCSVVSADCKQDSNSSREGHKLNSLNYEFLIYRNVYQGLEPQSSGFQYDEEDQKVEFDIEDDQLLDVSIPDGKAIVFTDQSDSSESSDEEYIEILEPQLKIHSQQLEQVEDKHEDKEEELVQDERQDSNTVFQSAEEETALPQTELGLESDDHNDSESVSEEHDDLIEQIKREIRNVRTGGLPTISEEDQSESTKMVENLKLKPLKIDEKLEYKDRIAEIQKVYKSYAEKMRKLDILNSQTMHAIGFLQLKDQFKPISMQKSSMNPIMKSLLSQNLLRCKAQRRPTVDPIPKFVGDLHKDLELVYVGQVCLSWEILHWQHRKAHELQQYEACEHHHYNAVATEFQLFQVLLQRFIEDGPFQGPRVQHYVWNRCVLRSLLQVPAIRDDGKRDKKLVMGGEEEDLIILSGMLVETIKESMWIFWKFIRKDERNAVLKSLQECQVEQKDLELLIDIRKDLQKKEKKLKDIQRSGNCVVKKFQKQHQQLQDGLEHSLFVAQIELRLVLRVLNLSKLTTDQLVWCQEKLDNINFVHRMVLMEPLFLLFPC